MPDTIKSLETLMLSFKLAVKSLKTNILRTSLSLLGVSIGIFSVSAIYTGVDSLNRYLIKSLDKFGNNTLFIDRFDYKNMGNIQWAKLRRMKRPVYDEYVFLKENLDSGLFKAMNFRMVVPSVPVKKGREKVRVSLVSDTYNVFSIMKFDLAEGRFYNVFEDKKGLPVAVIGGEVAEALFPGENPVGRYIQVFGKKIRIIGVLKKDTGMIKINPTNNQIFVPYNFVKKFYPGQTRFYSTIMVLPSNPDKVPLLKEQLERLIRKFRKLKPGRDNNFYINNIDFLKEVVEESMRTLSIAGWILGGFSLLVGAFGIANIMFVSVKERTKEIGIQKALGAKRNIIKREFLIESVLLSVIGGSLGFMLLFIAVLAGSKMFSGFELVVSLKNIFIAASVSVLIGIVAGVWPALQAAKLHPIDAIRKG